MNRHLTQHPQAGRLAYVLKRAQHALRTGVDNKLEPLGITAPQYNVLAAIEHNPGIQRHDHPQHGRVRRTELTSKGRNALEKAHKLLSGAEDVMTLGFSSREREELGKLLSRCIDNLVHHFR